MIFCNRGSRLIKRKSVLAIAVFVAFCSAPLAFAGPNNPVPLIQSLSPNAVVPGGGDFTLTVTGANFVPASVVYFGTTALNTNFVSASKLTATVTGPLIASATTGRITIQSPGSTARVSNVYFLPVQRSIGGINYVPYSYAAQTSALNVIDGDFRGNGTLDLVTSNYSSGAISVFLGNADGTFQPQVTYNTGATKSEGMAVGDVNNDGKLDIVVGHNGLNSTVTLLLGNGDGTFQPGVGVAGGTCLLSPELADVNGDGNLDLIAGNYCGEGITIALGNGDGTFQTPTTIATSLGSVSNVALADLNGDGIPDLIAICDSTNQVAALLGNGDGTFQDPQVYPATSPGGVAVGDFNDDGNLDVVVISSPSGSSGSVSLYLGNGDGTLQNPITVTTGGYYAVSVGDFNSDGKLDILANNGESGATELDLGNGDGTFQPVQTVATGLTSSEIPVGNFVPSGGLDFASTDANGDLQVLEPTVSLFPTSLDFGDVPVGTSSPAQTITVTNATPSNVSITSISLSGPNAADFSETGNCMNVPNGMLAPGASCAVQIAFTPSDANPKSSNLVVDDNAPASPQTASLSGTGSTPPVISLSPASLSFGNQDVNSASAPQSITLTNSSSVTLTVNGITIAGANASSFSETNNCGNSVAGGGNCTISVTFSPSAPGPLSADVSITDDAADSPQSVALSGTGLAAPTLTLSPASLAFSGQDVDSASAPQPVTVTNSSAVPVILSGITITGANTSSFSETNNCGTSLAAGSHCTISVTLSPSAAGLLSAKISVTDDAAASPQSVPLSGTGEDFALTFNTNNQTIAADGTANFAFTITPEDGFASNIRLSCGGAFGESSCTINPASVTPNGQPAAGDVSFTANSSLLGGPSGHQAWPGVSSARLTAQFVLLLIGFVVFVSLPRRRGSLMDLRDVTLAALLVFSLMFGAIALGGCGITSTNNTGTGTATATYVLTVTASSGSLTHTSTLTVTAK